LSWIGKVSPEDADGPIGRIYDEAMKRAGRIYEIVKLQSLRPDILRAWLGLYQAVMLTDSGLSRVEREMVAVVVSKTNDCHY
jgi:alkylhydroperoxidase family enzyme